MAGLALVAMLGGTATASPLKIRNGSTVRVALQGKREPGVGLRSRAGGWQLELAPSAGAVADVFDVTEGAGVAEVDGAGGGRRHLPRRRRPSSAGHAYRVHRAPRRRVARRDAGLPVSAVGGARATKVTFDDADTPATAAAATRRPSAKKPAL